MESAGWDAACGVEVSGGGTENRGVAVGQMVSGGSVGVRWCAVDGDREPCWAVDATSLSRGLCKGGERCVGDGDRESSGLNTLPGLKAPSVAKRHSTEPKVRPASEEGKSYASS